MIPATTDRDGLRAIAFTAVEALEQLTELCSRHIVTVMGERLRAEDVVELIDGVATALDEARRLRGAIPADIPDAWIRQPWGNFLGPDFLARARGSANIEHRGGPRT